MWRSAVQVCLGLRSWFKVYGSWFKTLNRSPLTVNRSLGGLAQLARAPALQAGGQRFESVILHFSGVRVCIEVLPFYFFTFLPLIRSLTY